MLHFEESSVHEKITFDLSKVEQGQEQNQQEDKSDVDVGGDVGETAPTRKIYYNTLCYYFWHSKHGCARPDCHFIHDEYTTTTYKKKTEDVEVKIFLRNIPPLMTKADIALLVNPHGYIKHLHLLPSQFASGRRAAIILMKNEEAASAAIDALNNHVDYTGDKLCAEKQPSTKPDPKPDPKPEPEPKPEPKPKPKPKHLPSFSVLGAEKERLRAKAPSPESVVNNKWCLLCIDESDTEPDTEPDEPDKPAIKTDQNIGPKPAKLPVVTGPWADAERKRAVMQW